MRRILLFSLAALLVCPLIGAEAWENATEFPGVDLSGLTAQQRFQAAEIMRRETCGCGCPMRIAECRTKDPNCGFSVKLANMVVASVRAGKGTAAIIDELSKVPHRDPGKILENPIPVKTDGAPFRGPANAKLTIVEFSDFQCPYCSVAVAQAYQVLKMYPNDVKLVFKQFPLDELHPQARIAAEAALSANNQGKFWEMHDKLFSNARRITRENIYMWAREIGLNMQKFDADMKSDATKKAVQADVAQGFDLGVAGTPTFFLNGKRYNGVFDAAVVKPLIDAELKQR